MTVRHPRLPFTTGPATKTGPTVARANAVTIAPAAALNPARSNVSPHGVNTKCVDSAPRFAAIRVPDLPIWVWRRLEPALANGEVAVIDQDRVLCCSPGLRQLGVCPGWAAERVRTVGRRAGMTLALRSWPGLQLDLVWEDLLHELNTVTPWLEVLAHGLIITHLLDDAQVLEVAQRFAVAVGVANDRMTAHVAALTAEAGAAVAVPAGDETKFRAALPIACLGHDGIDDETLQRLVWLGLTTVGSMTRLSLAQLSARFACGERLYELSRDGNRRPLSLYHPPPTITEVATPTEPWRDAHAAEPALRKLVEQVTGRLQGRVTGQLTLTLDTDIGTLRARRWLREPTADMKKLLIVARRLWRELLEQPVPGAAPLDDESSSQTSRATTRVAPTETVPTSSHQELSEIAQIRLTSSGLRWPTFGQATLFSGRGPSCLQTVLTRLATRFPGRVRRIELLDPDGLLPEESFRLVDAVDADKRDKDPP